MTEILGIPVEAGRKTFGYLDVSTTAIGEPLRIAAHVACGAAAGPTVLIGSASHGNEVTTILALREVLDRVRPAELKGTIVAVPLMNPLSFDAQSPMSDEDDWTLDESFPTATSGAVFTARGWVTQQIAGVLARLVNESSCVIDLHAGELMTGAKYVWFNEVKDATYDRKVRALADAFGFEFAYRSPAPSASLASYAALANVPAIMPAFGGVLPGNRELTAQGVEGVLSVLRHLGMLDGAPRRPATAPALLTKVERLRLKDGGMFYPEVSADRLAGTVAGGTVLGRVVNPFTLKELQTVVAPFANTVLLALRGGYSHVEPGDDAFIVADAGSRAALL